MEKKCIPDLQKKLAQEIVQLINSKNYTEASRKLKMGRWILGEKAHAYLQSKIAPQGLLEAQKIFGGEINN